MASLESNESKHVYKMKMKPKQYVSRETAIDEAKLQINNHKKSLTHLKPILEETGPRKPYAEKMKVPNTVKIKRDKTASRYH